jgi:hypothetical protein
MDLVKEAVRADLLEAAIARRVPALSSASIERSVARLEYLMIGCLFFALERGAAAFVGADPAWGWPRVLTAPHRSGG